MIYEYTFANATVHVQPRSSYQGLYLLQTRAAQQHQSVVALLMTCHLMRKEATSVFKNSVVFDLTPYYNCMAAVYELGPDICRSIEAIQIEPRMAKRLAAGLQQGCPSRGSYWELLPSLRKVFIKHDSELFGPLLVTHDLAIRALRVYFGHERLEVCFEK